MRQRSGRKCRRSKRSARSTRSGSCGEAGCHRRGRLLGDRQALTLAGLIAGDEVAKTIQLAIEYDPQPPYDAGSPAKAGPEIIAVNARLRDAPAVPVTR
jgi:hypothetical protein